MTQILSANAQTFTINNIDGEFTIGDRKLFPDGSSIITGQVSWDSLTINGVEYPGGYATIEYVNSDSKSWHVDLQLLAGLFGRSHFTDAAREKVRDGIKDALGFHELMRTPTVEEINTRVLEAATRLGNSAGNLMEVGGTSHGPNSILSEWESTYYTVMRYESDHAAAKRNSVKHRKTANKVQDNDVYLAYAKALRAKLDEKIADCS